jgi:anti-sigma factor (TIGR02949 family)
VIDCNEILRSLDAFLDGELSVEDSRHFEDHVAACFPCHQRQEFRRVLRQVVRTKLIQCDLPHGLAERIRGAIHSPEDG